MYQPRWLLFLAGLGLSLLAPAPGLAQADRPADDGPALYAQYCADCHRPLEKTTKAQRSASRLRSANRQFPAMARLDALSDEQLAAIASALKTIPLTTD